MLSVVYGGCRDREQLPPAGLIGKEGMSHKLGKVGREKSWTLWDSCGCRVRIKGRLDLIP